MPQLYGMRELKSRQEHCLENSLQLLNLGQGVSMPYLIKITDLPYKREVEKVHSSRYGKKGVKPAAKSKPTKEDVEKVNERNRIKKLRRKIEMNFDFGDYHTVLTYRKEERPEPAEVKTILKDFLKELRKLYRKLGEELKYIVVTEYETTAIHHHLIINDIGRTPALVRKAWTKGNVFFTVVRERGDVENLAAYLVKETQKSFRNPDNPSKLSYSCSRNLKPVVTKTKVVDAKTWRKEPVAPEGYWIAKDSIIEGFSKITGYPYQYYTCYKISPELEDNGNWIKPRERRRRGS